MNGRADADALLRRWGFDRIRPDDGQVTLYTRSRTPFHLRLAFTPSRATLEIRLRARHQAEGSPWRPWSIREIPPEPWPLALEAVAFLRVLSH